MSQEKPATNFRLLGSPVNLSYRNKRRDDRKNISNRPRSALYSSACNQDPAEKARPFSADAKRNAFKPTEYDYFKKNSRSQDNVCDSLNSKNVKVLAPTANLLGICKNNKCKSKNDVTENCSNASDYGSEDTFVSLGTKIKVKAQTSNKSNNYKNYIKYRNIAKKDAKNEADFINMTDFNVKISEKSSPFPNYPNKNPVDLKEPSNESSVKNFNTYSHSMHKNSNQENESLTSRVSFAVSDCIELNENAPGHITDHPVSTYSKRLNSITKHQLSLVEEESNQDVESVRSQSIATPRLANEANLKHRAVQRNNNKTADVGNDTFRIETKISSMTKNNVLLNNERSLSEEDYPATYKSFYEDLDNMKTCHENGYIFKTSNKNKAYEKPYSYESITVGIVTIAPSVIPTSNTSRMQKDIENTEFNNLVDKSDTKSLTLHKYPWDDSSIQNETVQSDFFLRKNKCKQSTNDGTEPKSLESDETKVSFRRETKTPMEYPEYPSYLLNTSSKSYTSKVLDDYKKEIQAINNLHELTLKDIKTDAISPTPYHIDKMFQNVVENSKIDSDSATNSEIENRSKSTFDEDSENAECNNQLLEGRDIDKISTQELIENYLKVKSNDFDSPKKENKINYRRRSLPKDNNKTDKSALNNAKTATLSKSKTKLNNVGQKNNPKNIFTMNGTQSTKFDSYTTDKDIDSWVSLTNPTPRSPLNSGISHEEENDKGDQNLKAGEVCNTSTNIDNSTKNNSDEVPGGDNCEPREDTRNAEAKSTVIKNDLNENSTVLDIYSMLKEIESFGSNQVVSRADSTLSNQDVKVEEAPKDNYMEILAFLDNVEESANQALTSVTSTAPQTVPKLDQLLRLPQTELAQRLITATLQLEERSCCIALLQESLANHKEQMINKVNALEKSSQKNITRVKQECEDAVKRHQNFIDQLINDKKTLNHRIEQLVDEKRAVEDRWKRANQAVEERYKLELKNQHDKMVASQQVAKQRWVKQKAEKIKELTVKGLEGELREMADRQQKEVTDLKMSHAEHIGRLQAKHAEEMDQLRDTLLAEKEAALIKERQLAGSRMEKQILELELSYQEQRKRIISELRAENEKTANEIAERACKSRQEIEEWRKEQEKVVAEKKAEVEEQIAKQRELFEEELRKEKEQLTIEFEHYKREFEAEQQATLRKKIAEIAAQHKQERDREIEKAIENMEIEAQAGRREMQESLRRNKEQYEIELKELAETEQATLKRYQDAQARIRLTEDKCASLEVSVSQLEIKNRVLTEKCSHLEEQLSEARASCEAEWRAKLDAARQEMAALSRKHDEQMMQLYAKVKVAVARKDSAICALRRDTCKLQERAALLEQRLQQQRRDYLAGHRHK